MIKVKVFKKPLPRGVAIFVFGSPEFSFIPSVGVSVGRWLWTWQR